ncbi:MAG: hypothetical protein K2Y14_01250 [Burkholderiales bacterium]|nr:hypothetical protein [Burkholderiales bacterium]
MKKLTAAQNKLKLQRDELVLDIVRLGMIITETTDLAVEVNLTGFVGRIEVVVHPRTKGSIRIIDFLSCMYYPIEDRAWHEAHFPLDYKSINRQLEQCKSVLNDLLIGKLTYDDLELINKD